ncbi:MAG TPA: hypothetical protein VK210_17480 [Terriglobia bacterium]|nr:hypothetical protein [Terriglobia bacterium]
MNHCHVETLRKRGGGYNVKARFTPVFLLFQSCLVVQHAMDFSLQWGKIARHRIPDRFNIHSIVLMTEPVADSTNVVPRQSRA